MPLKATLPSSGTGDGAVALAVVNASGMYAMVAAVAYAAILGSLVKNVVNDLKIMLQGPGFN